MSVATPIFRSGPVVLPSGFNPYLGLNPVTVNSSPFMLNQRNLREKTVSSQETTQTTSTSSSSSSSSFSIYILTGVLIVGVLIYTTPTKTVATTAYKTVA